MANDDNKLRRFGIFTIDLDNNVLWVENEPVDLAIKAVQLLGVLIERDGEVVPKEDLLDLVWGDSFVEESVLTQNVYLLRKLFQKHGVDKNSIQTIPKRGYRFKGEITEIIDRSEAHTDDLEETSDNEFQPELQGSAPKDERPDVKTSLRSSPWIILASAVFGALFLVALGFLWGGSKSDEKQINSVAVLPFTNLNDHEQEQSLSLGLTDNLINRLGSINRFTVRPLSSVLKYSGSDKDAVEIGRTLTVDAVLVGTIQTVESTLRVNVRLVDVKNGSQLWSANFDEAATDILKLQDNLSAQVARSLVSQLTKNENEKLTIRLTDNNEAYESYLKGRYFWRKRTKDDLNKAITYFEKAIELDKNFSQAYVSLADSQYLLFDYNWDESPENPRKAKENLLKALSIKPDLVDALGTLGLIRTTFDWDWEQAEISFKRALEIEPRSATVLHRYGMLLTRLRRFTEARQMLSKAREIDPLSVSINMNYGVAFLYEKKFDEGEKQFKQSLEIESGFTPARWYLARSYWHRGNKEEAVVEIMRALEDSGEKELAEKMSNQKGGAIDKMRILYEGWHEDYKNNKSNANNLAFAASFLGDKELTLSWLEKSVENHDTWAAWIHSQPEFDFLRDEPRFKTLIKKMKFEA